MKKLLLMFMFIASTLGAVEILNEFYVMQKVIPLLKKEILMI